MALARALVIRPSVLLLDEPLAALDMPVRMKIAEDLRQSIRELPTPVLYVTHSRDEVFMLGEKNADAGARQDYYRGNTASGDVSATGVKPWPSLPGFENVFDAEVTSIHEERGTMTCKIGDGKVELETPLVRAEVGSKLRVGISAGDVLLR